MTYDALKVLPGKRAVQIVELHLDRCSLTYGGAPCTAAIGVTGTDRCFNTSTTCQDIAHFASTERVYRFATTRIDGIQAPGDPPTFPTLVSVQSAPTVLTPGQGLGVRSQVSCVIKDHPWTDVGCDKYRTLRSYNPDGRGTFWGRFLTRNKWYQNRTIKIQTGFLNPDGSYDAANFKTRTYIITKISGPNPDGTVTVEGTDPLRLADGEKAKWPAASTATLTSDIISTDTAIPITDPGLLVTAWWTSGQRYIRIENEIALATAIAGSGTTAVTLTVTRSNMPAWYDFSANLAVAHKAAATVQPCHLFNSAMVYDVVNFLLGTVAAIPSAYLPYADWKAYIDANFPDYKYSRLLTSPTDVKTMLTELTQLGVLIWWHERDSQVKLKGLRFQQLIGPQINDGSSIIGDTVQVTDDPSLLMTEHWLYFDVIWPLANMQQWSTYRVVDVEANLAREGSTEYGKPAIKQVQTQWLTRGQAGLANEIGQTQLRQYQDLRKVITLCLDPKDDQWWVGDTVGVSTRYVQDETGAAQPRNYLITQVAEVAHGAGYVLQYTMLELFSFVRTGLIAHPATVGDATPSPGTYSAATTANKNKYAFLGYSSGFFPDGTKSYQIV